MKLWYLFCEIHKFKSFRNRFIQTEYTTETYKYSGKEESTQINEHESRKRSH